jgi:RNA polymerase sigma factor (sigma-70 family)
VPFDPDTAIGGPYDHFPSTRLSLLETASAANPLSRGALDQVAALYWKPVYKYVRLKWRKTNEDAKDLTQAFFTSALEREFFGRFDPQQASFRTYLRMAVDRFAANAHAAAQRQKRGGGAPLTSLDSTRDSTIEVESPTESPEDAFHREWQRQLFSLAIDDLRAHSEQTAKQIQFKIFEEYDLAADSRPSYADLADRYNIASTTVTNHLAWARRTLRVFVTARLRAVTSGDRELRSEIRSAFGKDPR